MTRMAAAPSDIIRPMRIAFIGLFTMPAVISLAANQPRPLVHGTGNHG